MAPMLQFTIHHTSAQARRGTLILNHGTIDTPQFMPVGTYGTSRA
jgi:tRNA-guanine transglycosylase (EC 2.4.2.29)